MSENSILNAIGFTRGRVTFQLGDRAVRTPEFDFYQQPPQFGFVTLDFDPHDPAGYEPTYGNSISGPRVLHVLNPADPELDTYWHYQVALEVAIEENADTIALAPGSIAVDLIAYDENGQVVDSLPALSLVRDDSETDPLAIKFRSDLIRPIIMVDTGVNEAAFPELRVLRVSPNGFIIVRKR